MTSAKQQLCNQSYVSSTKPGALTRAQPSESADMKSMRKGVDAEGLSKRKVLVNL